jgi:hypothetical protein
MIMADFNEIRRRVRISQAKSLARTLIGMKSDPAEIAAACALAAERFPDIDPTELAEAIQAGHDRAREVARTTLMSAHISARAAIAYEDLTGQALV